MAERLPSADITSVIAALKQANTAINPSLLSFSLPLSATNKNEVVVTKVELETFFPNTDETSFSSNTSSENLMTAFRKEKNNENNHEKKSEIKKDIKKENKNENKNEMKKEIKKEDKNENKKEIKEVLETKTKIETPTVIPVSAPAPAPIIPAWGGWGMNGGNNQKTNPGKKPDDFLCISPIRHTKENHETEGGGLKCATSALQELKANVDIDKHQENVLAGSNEVKESSTQLKKKSFLEIQVCVVKCFTSLTDIIFFSVLIFPSSSER